jgi:arsenate reductase
MAEGLARKMLGPRAELESTGTNAHGGRASSLAIEVMRSRFGIDISTHNSRNVKNVSVNDFDYVVAMDNMVADDLRSMYPNINARLITWNVDDPIGRGVEAYERCAREIHKRIEELSGFVKEKKRKG